MTPFTWFLLGYAVGAAVSVTVAFVAIYNGLRAGGLAPPKRRA